MASNKEDIRDFIRKNYGDVAKANSVSTGSCCSSSCCGDTPVDISAISEQLGYSAEDLAEIPAAANMGLGCGNPVAIAALKEGEVVLDLGSGGGIDCFLARKQVGQSGRVIGVDMTPEMIRLARENAAKAGYDNVEFRLGEIEHLPVADNSVDVIISNCVINLSTDKRQVLKEAYRVLKPGGRISFSDVVATAPLPEKFKKDLRLIANCIGGAEYVEDFRVMLEEAGFKEIRLTPNGNSEEFVKTWAPDKEFEGVIVPHLIEATK